jgi:hypothetical protein
MKTTPGSVCARPISAPSPYSDCATTMRLRIALTASGETSSRNSSLQTAFDQVA